MTTLSHRAKKEHLDHDLALNPRFTREAEGGVRKYKLPAGGTLPQTAFRIVHDEMMLDGNARFNLATFVTTWMNDQANRLSAEAADKNMIDKDEYPATAEIAKRCVRMLADLWHAPEQIDAIGTSTRRPAGSSRRSSIPTSSGTSGFQAWSRSGRRVTSTAWCTRASAGSCGATSSTCRRT